jgi:hypothetical protein
MRRKLIEQVIEKACLCQKFSAGNTATATSDSVDREGYLSARIIGQTKSLTIADTQAFTFYVYDSSDNSTFAIYDSANATDTIAVGVTTGIETGGFDVDLIGANRYIKVYAAVTGATTVTAFLTAACILGDGVNEPAT